jgi:hypothetical protein
MSNPQISSSSARREVDYTRLACELATRLQDKEEALLAEKAKLTSKTERIREALQMLAYVEPVAKKMAGKMKDLTNEEKIIFIRAACGRIWIDANNEIEIELSLPGLEAFAKCEGDNEDASESDNSSSPPLQSAPSDDFPAAEWGRTICRYTRNTDCRHS